MKTVQAYKCDYCGKVYENKSTCRSHEYRCYFNPRTKSCASCCFFSIATREYKPCQLIQYKVCYVNINIIKKGLQTKCKKYLNKKYWDDKDIKNIVMSEFDRNMPFKAYIEKLNL